MGQQATGTSRVKDINGFWEIENNPISKAGVFMYSGKALKEFFPELIETEFYPVLRSPEVLSDPECVASFRLQPWVDNHPKVLLGDPAKGGIDPSQKGIEGVIGEKVYYDPEDQTLKGNLKIFSFTHDKRIDEGKIELSLGYRCKYKRVDGEYAGQNYVFAQYDIRGNHLASVDIGRMGQDVAVMDGFTFTIDSQEFITMPTAAVKKTPAAKKPAPKMNRIAAAVAGIMAYTADAAEGAVEGDTGEIASAVEIMKKVKPLLDQLSEMTSVADAPAMEPEDGVGDGGEGAPVVAADADAGGAAAAAGEKKDDKKEGAAMDAAEIQRLIAAGVAEAMKPFAPKITAAMDAGEMMREISARDALAKQLGPFIGTFDHAEMTHAQVAEYGVKKLELNAPKGQEIVALQGYLHGRTNQRAVSGSAMDAAEQTSLQAVDKLLFGA